MMKAHNSAKDYAKYILAAVALALVPALNQNMPVKEQSTTEKDKISVTDTGKINVDLDKAEIYLGVLTEAKTAEKAQKQNTEMMGRGATKAPLSSSSAEPTQKDGFRKHIFCMLGNENPKEKDYYSLDSMIKAPKNERLKVLKKIRSNLGKTAFNWQNPFLEEYYGFDDTLVSERDLHISLSFYVMSLSASNEKKTEKAVRYLDTAIAFSPFTAELYDERSQLKYMLSDFEGFGDDAEIAFLLKLIKRKNEKESGRPDGKSAFELTRGYSLNLGNIQK